MERTRSAITAAEAWKVAQGLIRARIAPDAGLLAQAFMHAVGRGWLPEDELPGETISTALPNANERLKARSMFLSMLRTPLETDVQAWAAVEAISLAPQSWQVFGPTKYYLLQLSKRVHRAEAPNAIVEKLDRLL